MSQLSFSDEEYSGRKRITKREEFLKTMNEIIPWAEWVERIRPFYPSGKRGRPVRGIEMMLRMYLLQIWFGLSDEGTEDAIYDSYAMRSFLGLNFMMEQVPDSGYIGIEKREEIRNDEHLSQIEYKIGRRPSKLNVRKGYTGIDWEREIEHRKSSVRCTVEHPFLIVKRQFKFSKTVYGGIRKNLNRLYMLFGSANILMCARAGRTKEFRRVCLG